MADLINFHKTELQGKKLHTYRIPQKYKTQNAARQLRILYYTELRKRIGSEASKGRNIIHRKVRRLHIPFKKKCCHAM